MSPLHRRSSVRSLGRARRRTSWVELSSSGISAGAIGHGFNTDLLTGWRALAADMPGTTILRTHLRIYVASAVAAGDGFKWGLCVLPQSQIGAYATGAGSTLTNPVDLPYANWLMIAQEGAHPGYGIGHQNGPNNQVEYDVKSRRRIGNVESTYVLSVANTGAAASFSFNLYARILLALP